MPTKIYRTVLNRVTVTLQFRGYHCGRYTLVLKTEAGILRKYNIIEGPISKLASTSFSLRCRRAGSPAASDPAPAPEAEVGSWAALSMKILGNPGKTKRFPW